MGAVAATQGIPFLIFTTFAGVLIDKVDKQKLLVKTQAIEMVFAAALGVLVLSGHINLFLLSGVHSV